MKWQKLGQIFKCEDYGFHYAQSPQTLILSDRIRIYFSTRKTDHTGKFLSHVAYVDFDKKLQTILGVSNKPVLPLGELGCFDEHGIFPINIFQDGDKINAYTCGWSRRQSVSVETSTGFVTSSDNGENFTRIGTGPIFGASLHEPCLVGDSFVRKYDGIYHMWYIYGQRWIKKPEDNNIPERVYKIAHAISYNGLDWTPEGRDIIEDTIGVDECQALPTVLKIDDTYHMYFCFRHAFDFRTNSDKAYRLGYATSHDPKNWMRADAQKGIEPSKNDWDSQMMCYPHLFETDNCVYLLYNGNHFGQSGFGAAILVK